MRSRVLKNMFQFLPVLIITYCGSVSGQTDGYQSFSELERSIEQLADDYPKLVSISSLGNTLDDRKIWSMTLSAGNSQDKPAILLAAGIEGPDLAGTEILMAFAKWACSEYGRVDSITRMLDKTTFYILPRTNPDASETLFMNPAYARTLNSRPMDLGSDGSLDEDGYDDLNNDGQITWMRITTPGGEWVADDEYPGILRKADAGKNETGIYRLLREGLDNDKDGKFNEDEPGGVNFNRNFTHKYQYFSTGAGPHQISEVETRAVADFAYAHPNIVAIFCFGPNDNLNHPWQAAKGAAPAKPAGRARKPVLAVDQKDVSYYAFISEEFKKLTGLKDLEKTAGGNGAFNEWAYFHFGRWAFSTPAWWAPEVQSAADTSAHADSSVSELTSEERPAAGAEPKSHDQKLWNWMQNTGQKNAFIPWREYEHPDFPDSKVEIGGFRPLPAHNPPVDSLPGLAAKYHHFFYALGDWLPRIDIRNLKVENLHDNVYRISLVVLNEGYLSTNTHLGTRNKWCPKIKLALDLADNQSLAGGKILQFIDILAGSGASKEMSWTVIGKKGDTVKMSIGSPMTGTIMKTVKLQ